MYVDYLALNNYRNYKKLEVKFSKGTNILYGDNAQGKTNILESIYMAVTTKSHRSSKDKEVINFQEEESHIRIGIVKNQASHRIDMHIRKNKNKGVAIDGIPIKKIIEIYGLANIIIFSPEDLGIIKNSPNERRRFIDMELCQLNKIYYSNLYNYNKILNQRNNLLRQISINKKLIDTLDIWDEQLVEYGKKVIKDRNNFIISINDIIKKIHKKITSDKEEIEIIYEKNILEKEFEKTLKEKRENDLKYQTTQIGPHRDDIIFMINGIDIRKYGSQGQQRTVALSLKLAEIELVKKVIKDKPILLLDDVMSELDEKRRDSLFEYIKDIQTIITCTGYDSFIKDRININKIFYINNGNIREVKDEQ